MIWQNFNTFNIIITCKMFTPFMQEHLLIRIPRYKDIPQPGRLIDLLQIFSKLQNDLIRCLGYLLMPDRINMFHIKKYQIGHFQ